MLGVQLPNFVDQYEKRVDAHLKEVQVNFSEYQQIAKRYHNGSIEALVKEHENSNVASFRSEAVSIRNIHQRKLHFEAEQKALAGAFWTQALHVIFRSDSEILNETFKNYSVNIPLNTAAIVSGLTLGLVSGLLLELLLYLFRLIMKKGRKTQQAA
jgi:hypothetical protein